MLPYPHTQPTGGTPSLVIARSHSLFSRVIARLACKPWQSQPTGATLLSSHCEEATADEAISTNRSQTNVIEIHHPQNPLRLKALPLSPPYKRGRTTLHPRNRPTNTSKSTNATKRTSTYNAPIIATIPKNNKLNTKICIPPPSTYANNPTDNQSSRQKTRVANRL